MPMSPRLLRPRASGQFDPRSIAGLAAWYDAADSSTLFDADTGGALVAANGTVGRWQDKSGNGRHATQAIANNRPQRQVNVFSGRDALTFDGSNDALILSSNVTMSGGASIIVVSRKTNSANQGGFHSLRGFVSSNHHPFTDGNAYDGFASTARFSFAQAYRSDVYVWSVIAGSQWTAYANNSVLDQRSYTSANQSSGSLQALGAGSTDASAVTGFWFAGQICEVLIFTRGISVLENTRLYNYLKAKWGTA